MPSGLFVLPYDVVLERERETHEYTCGIFQSAILIIFYVTGLFNIFFAHQDLIDRVSSYS